MNNEELMTKVMEMAEDISAMRVKIDQSDEMIKEIRRTLHDKLNEMAPLELVVKQQEQLDYIKKRQDEWDKRRLQQEAVKTNHRAIVGWFLTNWKFLSSIIVAAGVLWGAVDIALKVPSKEQQKEIHHLQSQISQVKHEVRKDS